MSRTGKTHKYDVTLEIPAEGRLERGTSGAFLVLCCGGLGGHGIGDDIDPPTRPSGTC